MRLDRDTKQPIWLGLVLIFAAFIFTLFFITRVHASELQTYGYNNVIIISGTGQRISFCFADGSFGLRFSFNPTDEDDGYNIYTHEEFEQRFNDFFAYVLPSQTYIVFYDDYVAKGTYEFLEEYFLSKGCAWALTDAVFPMTFPDSFSLMQGHAGMWFFPYYTRSVPLTPTATPSPTPELEQQSFDILVYYDPWFSSDNGIDWSIGYYLFTFNVSTFPSVNVPSSLTYSTALDSGFSNPWINNAVLNFRSGLNEFCLYFAGSLSSAEVRFLGSTSPSGSFDSIKENFSAVLLSFSNSSINVRTASYGGLSCVCILSDATLSNFRSNFLYNLGSYTSYSISQNNFFDDSSSSHSNPLYLAYCLGLSGSSNPSNPDITPSPGPTATPEPLPTSSESIHVILPSGTPTPTPPFSVPVEDPVGGSGSPGGSSQGSLTSGQVNSTLNTFKQYTQNNGAFAFLYACTGLIPDDALYFLFILLFILLLLACLRLFVHFTGG